MPAEPFRNPQVAAPLKPEIVGDADDQRAAFRNPQVAAPLKPGAVAGAMPTPEPFPQPSSCGSIEA